MLEARTVAGLAVLINRTAHRFARDADLVAATHAAAGPDAVVVETHDVAEIGAAARQIRHARPDTIALCGGDGTYMSGLTALATAYGSEPLPRIALVPGGTVSTIARNFGMTGTAAAVLARVVSQHGNGGLTTRRHRTLVANERVGFIFGTALVANFFDLYYGGEAAGYGDAARIVGRIFVESFFGGPFARRVLEPVECTIDVDGVPLSARRYSLICCATVRNLGLHMMVSYRAGERDDALHLVASSLSTRRLGPQMLRVVAGQRLRGAEHFDGLVRRFRVTFPETRAWVLDGDLLYDRVVHVAAGPAIEVVTGDADE
jgi:diacylglycerol kinase family enzyme